MHATYSLSRMDSIVTSLISGYPVILNEPAKESSSAQRLKAITVVLTGVKMWYPLVPAIVFRKINQN